jgi:hypothetical protein
VYLKTEMLVVSSSSSSSPISLISPDWLQLRRCSPHLTFLRAGF